MNIKNKTLFAKGIILKIYLLIYCLLLVSIPFTDLGEAIPNILIIVLVFLFPFVFKICHLNRLNIPLFIGLILWVCVAFFQMVYFSRWEDLNFILKFVMLIVIYGLSAPILIEASIKKILYSYLIGVSFLLIFSCFNILKEILFSNDFSLSVGEDVNRLLLGDRPFIGFVYVLGFFISLFLLFNIKNKFKFFLIGLLALVLLGFIFLITARTSIMSLAISGLISFFYIKDLKIKLSVLLITVLATLCLVFFSENFKSRLTLGFKNEKKSLDKIIKLEPRYYIWGCVNTIVKETSPSFSGYGFIKTQVKLNNCYAETKDFFYYGQQNWFLEKKFNTHNQYLNFYLSSGFLGLSIFIAICIYCIIINRKSFFGLVISLSMFLFFMFENVLSRQMGVELFALTLVFSNMISLGYIKKF